MGNNFIFIGDSLTSGYGVKNHDCWVNRIGLLSDMNIINKGRNGSTTADMLVRFDNDVLSYSPIKVFIMGGTNDLLCNRTVESIIKNIEIMIKELKLYNIDVIIGIPPDIIVEDAYNLFTESPTYDYCKESLTLLRKKLISLCKYYNCLYIDFYKLTSSNIKNNIYLDGIHLNTNGNDLIYNEFIRLINIM